jgi:hypothetical protein
MELTRALQTLWSNKIAIALGTVVALCVSVLSAYSISLSPLALKPRTLSYGSATTQVLFDTRRSSLASVNASPAELSARAEVFSQFLASQAARDEIGRRMGVPATSIAIIASPNTVDQRAANQQSLQQQRLAAANPGALTITYQVQLDTPVLAIFTQAASGEQALELARAAADSLRLQVSEIGDRSGVDAQSPNRIILREIGAPLGGDISTSVDRVRMVLAFVGVMVVWCFGILAVAAVRRGRSEHIPVPESPSPASD